MQLNTIVIKFLIDPFNILLFLVTLGFAAKVLEMKRLFKWVAFAALGWFFIMSTPLIPNLVLDSLEGRSIPMDVEALDDREINLEYHIVILGGGHGFDDRLPPNSLLSTQALARLSEGIRIHNQLPNSTLVLSGYSSSGRITQAEILQQTAVLLGVDPEKTVMQKEPANTFEEGKVYSERLAGSEKVILVTSAAHMPRAVGVFDHFEIDVIPSPAHYRITGNERHEWFGFPSINNMAMLRTGINEYAAILRDTLMW